MERIEDMADRYEGSCPYSTFLDGTDYACPAYWRGEDHMWKVIQEKLIEILKSGVTPSKMIKEIHRRFKLKDRI